MKVSMKFSVTDPEDKNIVFEMSWHESDWLRVARKLCNMERQIVLCLTHYVLVWWHHPVGFTYYTSTRAVLSMLVSTFVVKA